MIRKTKSSQPGSTHVVFELPACVWADRIFVSGDFNDWSLDSLPMHQGRDGVWRAAIDLPANRCFQFRYLVDGQWQTEWHADGFEENSYGSQNSVLDTTLLVERPQLAPGVMRTPNGSPLPDRSSASSTPIKISRPAGAESDPKRSAA